MTRLGALALTVALVGLGASPAHAAVPIASVSDTAVTEGDSGTASAVFTVTLSASDGTTTVDYTTLDNTATAGSDYTARSGTLTFGPGETQKTIAVTVAGDVVDEIDETFVLALTEIQNGTFEGGDPNGIGTILDDDPTPALSISDATVTEGNSGTTTATVTVSLSAPSGRSVTVDFATADGTATFSGSDYHSQSGRLVFAPGETAKTIVLTVVSDTVDESDETFFVNLSAPVAATIADGSSTITILDDDDPGQPPLAGPDPSISITDASVVEGNSDTVETTVTVSLSKESVEYVTVDFTTADNTATFSGSDYHSQSGRLVFAPGETAKTITLTVVGDTVDEANETFFLNLSQAANASIADGQALITITDDDSTTTQPPPPSGSTPAISVSDAQVSEGDSDDTKVTVTVSLSSASTSNVTVDFTTADGTATFSGSDYWSMSGRLVFGPGETTRTLTATVVGDVIDEADERFYIDLSNPTNATLTDARSVITIADDDAATPPPGGGSPSISINDARVQEGNADTTTATLTLSLSAASTESVSVDFTTTDGTADFEGGDYYETRGRLVFQPGETSATLQITVNGDTLAEGAEVFYVDLTNPVRSTISDARSAITISDDDAPDPSRTTLTVVKRSRSVIARGQVTPPHPGDRVRVVLKKRHDGRFRTFALKRPTLGEAVDRDGDGVFESTYSARFRLPGRGRCLIKAVFPGDADHTRSSVARRFRC